MAERVGYLVPPGEQSAEITSLLLFTLGGGGLGGAGGGGAPDGAPSHLSYSRRGGRHSFSRRGDGGRGGEGEVCSLKSKKKHQVYKPVRQ